MWFVSVLVVLLALPFWLYYHFKLPDSPPATFFEGLLLGHRGCVLSNTSDRAHLLIPENTLSSFKYAIQQNVDGVEFDIQLSKDGVVIVNHDLTTSRLCVDNSKVSSVISECNMDQLLLHRYKKAEEHERIPTLKEVLDLTQLQSPKKFKLMIEVKETWDYNLMADQIVKYFQEYDLYERAVVGSFHPVPLYLVRQRDPRIVTLLLVRDDLISKGHGKATGLPAALDALAYWSYTSWLPSFLGAGVIGFHHELIRTRSFNLPTWKSRGYVLNAWTVNLPEDHSFLSQHKVSVTTDFLFSSPSSPSSLAISAPITAQ